MAKFLSAGGNQLAESERQPGKEQKIQLKRRMNEIQIVSEGSKMVSNGC